VLLLSTAVTAVGSWVMAFAPGFNDLPDRVRAAGRLRRVAAARGGDHLPPYGGQRQQDRLPAGRRPTWSRPSRPASSSGRSPAAPGGGDLHHGPAVPARRRRSLPAWPSSGSASRPHPVRRAAASTCADWASSRWSWAWSWRAWWSCGCRASAAPSRGAWSCSACSRSSRWSASSASWPSRSSTSGCWRAPDSGRCS
jgi:hypothetical protein